ncbi:MAG TPA: hypothetical protein VE783_10730 [Candidatus Limnocylindrales bacterium]|jgi:hypothetical protein|nr:hypothetical protein [Candidatus Limnocylindrales bacterium]
MKKLILIAAALMMISSFAAAQTTASGTLSVTATVNGSINLVFNSDPAGVALTGSGTNAATLAFGTVQAFGGTLTTGVTRTPGTTSFTVSSPFDVNVAKANLTSANYTLKAQLNAADATNTWQVGGVTVTSAAAATITGTGSYDTNNAFTLALTIPFTTASGTSISNSLNFTATAN